MRKRLLRRKTGLSDESPPLGQPPGVGRDDMLDGPKERAVHAGSSFSTIQATERLKKGADRIKLRPFPPRKDQRQRR
jgi:hypothetical protein